MWEITEQSNDVNFSFRLKLRGRGMVNSVSYNTYITPMVSRTLMYVHVHVINVCMYVRISAHNHRCTVNGSDAMEALSIIM